MPATLNAGAKFERRKCAQKHTIFSFAAGSRRMLPCRFFYVFICLSGPKRKREEVTFADPQLVPRGATSRTVSTRLETSTKQASAEQNMSDSKLAVGCVAHARSHEENTKKKRTIKEKKPNTDRNFN